VRERAVSAEEAYLKQGFQLDAAKARAEKAEAILRAANFCEAHEPIPAQPEIGCPACEAVHQADLRAKAEAEAQAARERKARRGKREYNLAMPGGGRRVKVVDGTEGGKGKRK